MSVIVWIVALLLVALLSFIAGLAVGRGFWRDLQIVKTRR